jgi:transcriptional regulator with GAF, ATPase, and Fis domain
MAGVIVVRRDGTVETPAYTDELVLGVDRVQSSTGEGPCLQATYHESVFRIDDMANEQRWPHFAKQVANLGVQSMIACSLATEQGNRAALNLHTAMPAAFDQTAVEIASIYAAHSSVALSQAGLVDSLRTAVASRQVIGEATGILLERYRVDSRQAF